MRNEVLTVKEIARSRGVSLKWIYDLLAAGRLKGARKIGRVWQIPRSALDANRGSQSIMKGLD